MTNAVVAVAGSEEAMRALDHASQQGVVWFLSVVCGVLAVALFWVGRLLIQTNEKRLQSQFELIREATAQIATNNQSLQSKVQVMHEMQALLHETRASMTETTATLRQMKETAAVMTTIIGEAATAMRDVVMKLERMNPLR